MKKQKHTKKDGKTSKSRKDSKYPALDKSKNLLSRSEYIETDYVSGIYDETGQEIIRPLTDKEKEFLNKFYEETIVTNFYHDKQLYNLNKIKKSIIEDANVQELKNQLKETSDTKEKNRIKQLIKITKKQNEEIYAEELESLKQEMQSLRDENLLYSDPMDHRQFYKANNSRNNCVLIKAKLGYKLHPLGGEMSDEIEGQILEGFNENQLIDDIERSRWEEEEERMTQMLKEEKSLKKSKKSS